MTIAPVDVGPCDLVRPVAVLTDFGGVLTSDVFAAFRAVSERISGDPTLLERVLSKDRQAGRMLAEHECGRLPEAGFEQGLAERLRAHGVDAVPRGLISTIQTRLQPDVVMLAALRRLRRAGCPGRGGIQRPGRRLLPRLRPARHR